jgi:predicted ribosome quality control (RQC) complex YloA/Tae2 family protein
VSVWGARIARIDQPEPGLLSLSLRSEGRNEALLLVMLPGALGVGMVGDRPRGASANASISKLRQHLEGARIEAVEASRRVIRLSVARAGERRFLIAAVSKPHGAWWLCETDGSIVVRSAGAPAAIPSEGEHLRPKNPEELRASGTSAIDAHRAARRRQIEGVLSKEIKRLSKKRDAIRHDLARAKTAADLHEQASLILAHAAEIPREARHFEATTWGEKPRRIRVELDPRRSPTELAQELFAKSKRLKRAMGIAPERLDAVEKKLAELVRLRDELDAHSPQELGARLEALSVPAIVSPEEEARKRRRMGGRLPYRQFVTADGAAVLVGRSAADNDRLTLRVARPQDLWLHARDVTGAHVVVPLDRGKSCSSETLVDAATLAAHFSDLRGETAVDVLYAPRRFVRKRKGSAPGSVTLGREKVIAVRIEPKRLERLLKNEKKTP